MTGIHSLDNDVSVDELREAVEHMHGVPARFVEAVEVDERFNGEVVWQGAVKVFALGVAPVTDAATAVRAVILAQVREAERAKN